MTSINIRTVLLLGLLSAILVGVGSIFGLAGLIIGLVLAFVMNFVSYFFSDKLVLSMSHARQVSPDEEPVLHSVVSELAAKVGMPKPKVYVINNDSPNAFATGRDPNHAAVAATTGILRIMNRNQLSGVLAHELSHVRHRDTLWMAMAATVVGAIGYLAMMAQWAALFGGMGGGNNRRGGNAGLIGLLAVMILAPLGATLVQLAMSRQREYGADKGGAQEFGKPLELASALQTLGGAVKQKPMDVNPAIAHLFIVNPLKGGGVAPLFSTHPSTQERIRRLERMGGVRA